MITNSRKIMDVKRYTSLFHFIREKHCTIAPISPLFYYLRKFNIICALQNKFYVVLLYEETLATRAGLHSPNSRFTWIPNPTVEGYALKSRGNGQPETNERKPWYALNLDKNLTMLADTFTMVLRSHLFSKKALRVLI